MRESEVMNVIVTTWWTDLMMAFAAVLLAIVGVYKLHEWGIYPLREMTRIVRRPWFERLLPLVVICGMIHYGATKGTNGSDCAAPPSAGLMMVAAPVVSPVAVDSTGFSLPTNFPPVTNLCFWGIERDASYVSLGIAWPSSASLTNDLIDLYGHWRLASNGWSRLARIDVSGALSNAVAQLTAEDFPTNVMENAAFFRLASQSDSDSDGLTDAEEEWVIGTNPRSADSDGDGMPDGWEVGCGYDPLAFGELLDTDADGLPDNLENTLGTNRNNPDSDSDGRDDGDEYYGGTDPLNPDTDGDGLSDGVEFSLGTDPNDAETYETENDYDVNIYEDGAPMLLTASLMSGGSSIFESLPETTQAPGPDYEMQGQYSISISYSGSCTDDFSVLGVCPMGGTTTLGADSCGSWYAETGPGYKNAFTLTASGASFKPLKTGRFAFQAHVDDTVVVSIGSKIQFSADFYGANPGVKTNAILIAGQTYPVSVEATSIGGPAELSFPAWGEFTPIFKPQVAVKLSRPVVIFENGYQNMPAGPVVGRRSTMVDLCIGVRGGGLGGTFQVVTQNGDRLELVGGDDCRTGTYSIAPDEMRYWQGTFAGVLASSTTNDVVVIATFTENETGVVAAYTNSMTVVQVEMTAVERAPQEADRHRHVFGVAEYVMLQHCPSNVTVELNFDSDKISFIDENTFMCHTQMDETFGSDVCTVAISCLGSDFTTRFRVFDVRVEARNPQVNMYDADVTPVFGEAGHLLLYLQYWAMPRFVSFSSINIREIPDDSETGPHSGYYDDRSKGGHWSHVSSVCGGWHVVSNRDEPFAVDRAGVGGG